jgi:hypothetical protein
VGLGLQRVEPLIRILMDVRRRRRHGRRAICPCGRV